MTWFWYALTSALLLSVATLIQKRALLKEHAMEFSASFSFVAALVSVPFFFAVDFSALDLKPIIILFFVSLLGAVAFLLVAKSIRHLEVSDSSPLLAFGPGITVFVAYLFLGESLSMAQGWGAMLLLVGAYVLETRPHQGVLGPAKHFFNSHYAHYILLAMLLYSITALFDRIILYKYNLQPEAFIAFAHVFTAIHFFIMMKMFHDGFRGIRTGLRSAGILITLVAIIMVVSRYAQAEAIKIAYVGLVVSLKRISIFLTTLVGGELFHERNLGRKVLASVIMVLGAILIAMQ